MSDTRDQTNVMIGYLLQVMYERGEMLRKEAAGVKEAERHASIIVSIARSISILREPYEYYDRTADAPAQPATEPAEWDEERTDQPEETAPDEESHE